MNLDSLTLRLRPRIANEAADLGQVLLRSNARQVYAAWLVTVIPIAAACMTLYPLAQWLPPLLIWWLKPLYDRVVLFVLSRAVFGESVGIRDLSWPQIFGSSLWWSLTLGRLEFARSFSLPVYLLEGLGFKRRRERFRVLNKSNRGNAVMLTVVFLHVEAFVYFSLILLAIVMIPAQLNVPAFSWLFEKDTPLLLSVGTGIAYVIAMSLVEPLYVASGFTLYLNRRVELEAWDIEVDLRRHLSAVEDDAGDESSARRAA